MQAVSAKNLSSSHQVVTTISSLSEVFHQHNCFISCVEQRTRLLNILPRQTTRLTADDAPGYPARPSVALQTPPEERLRGRHHVTGSTTVAAVSHLWEFQWESAALTNFRKRCYSVRSRILGESTERFHVQRIPRRHKQGNVFTGQWHVIVYFVVAQILGTRNLRRPNI